jgi:hypothetical protein
MAQQGNPPVQEFRAGAVRAAIWKNEVQQDGRTTVRFSTKIEKRYRDKQSNEWRSTDQYFPEDLPKLALVATKAFEYTTLREEEGAVDASS